MSLIDIFEGSEQFYLADPNNVTIKSNGGKRWATKKEFNLLLEDCLEGHVNGTLNKGVVLPPIRKSDNKCKWGAIDVDGKIYNDDYFKQELLEALPRLNLPLIPCFSKSKGLHLYIFFKEWTDAQTVINILHTFLLKLNLPIDTECFPKQATVKDTGNGIMLPFMHGIGNDFIKPHYEKNELIMATGTISEFKDEVTAKRIDAKEIKIELPKEKPNSYTYEYNYDDNNYTKLEILKKIKEGTIEQHPTIGGSYYAWIQIVICKCIVQNYGDNEILKLIKEVHKDEIDGSQSEYTWPESYKKQITYTRGQRQLNKPNPGDTKILEGKSFDSAIKYEEIRDSLCYVMSNDMFNRIGTADFYLAPQINNYHSHEVSFKIPLTKKLLSDPQFKRAESFVTSAKFPPGLINITKPGIIPLINKGNVLNIYIPNYLEASKGDVQFILDFFIWLIGKEKWKITEQWIAYMLQHPGEKIKWAIVLVSRIEGVGKGLLARICSRILGSDNVNENANYKHLSNVHSTLLIGTQLLVLNELSLGDFKSKTEGTNTLKNYIGDDTYSCNFKGKPMVKLANLTNFMLFSNDEQVLGAPQGGRRYYFCNIKKSEGDIINKTNEGFFDKAWNFVNSDVGAAALINYFKHEVKLKAKDLEIFKRRAPITDDLELLIEQSKHPVQKKLEYDLNRPDEHNRRLFGGDWSGIITFDWLNEQLNTSNKDDDEKYNWGSYSDDALYKFLAANCIPWNNGENTRQISISGVKHRFYLLKDIRCPIPGKSYKDLTPKQIETIYKNYSVVEREIRKEEETVNKAKEDILIQIKTLKDFIQECINESNKKGAGEKFNNHFKDKTVDGAYDLIMNDTIKIINKRPSENLENIKRLQKIIDRGIRTPEEIIESYIKPSEPWQRKKHLGNIEGAQY